MQLVRALAAFLFVGDAVNVAGLRLAVKCRGLCMKECASKSNIIDDDTCDDGLVCCEANGGGFTAAADGHQDVAQQPVDRKGTEAAYVSPIKKKPDLEFQAELNQFGDRPFGFLAEQVYGDGKYESPDNANIVFSSEKEPLKVNVQQHPVLASQGAILNKLKEGVVDRIQAAGRGRYIDVQKVYTIDYTRQVNRKATPISYGQVADDNADGMHNQFTPNSDFKTDSHYNSSPEQEGQRGQAGSFKIRNFDIGNIGNDPEASDHAVVGGDGRTDVKKADSTVSGKFVVQQGTDKLDYREASPPRHEVAAGDLIEATRKGTLPNKAVDQKNAETQSVPTGKPQVLPVLRQQPEIVRTESKVIDNNQAFATPEKNKKEDLVVQTQESAHSENVIDHSDGKQAENGDGLVRRATFRP